MMNEKKRTLAVGCFLVLVVAGPFGGHEVHAAPFARWFEHSQSDGSVVRIWGKGDEFAASFEAEDGHAVVYNRKDGVYEYAIKSVATGALVSSGIVVGKETGFEREIASIPLHLRDTSEEAKARAERRYRERMIDSGRLERWRRIKESTAERRKGALLKPPADKTSGSVVGLTILVDFPLKADGTGSLAEQVHPAVTKAVLEDLLNGDSFSQFGNYSSVRKYFQDVSCGRLDYRNEVVGWIKVPHPRSYYDNVDKDCGKCGRLLIGDALDALAKRADYETAILPKLRSVSVGSGNAFKALNVFYAGEYPESQQWDKGLWPHQWELPREVYEKLPVSVGGRSCHFEGYQISPVSTNLQIGTFCHESGHLICDFPDLYDIGEKKACHGVGRYSLMCANDDYCPQYVDAYLRVAAGWVEPKMLPSTPGMVTVKASLSDVWRFDNPRNPKEYFLIENRQKTGRDRAIGGSGIYILRCDEYGDNTRPKRQEAFARMGKGAWRMSNELSIEQADGLYHLEQMDEMNDKGKQNQRNGNDGDACDAWYAGNPARGYTGVFNAETTPCARWKDGTPARLSLRDFSANGSTMTFYNEGYAVDAVSFTPVDGTVFWYSTSVSLQSSDSNATIHYTLDGTEPTAESPVYLLDLINLMRTTTVKAIAIKDGVASKVCSATYRKMDLGAALNAPQLTWRNDPVYPWAVQSTNTHDGVAAAQSGWMPLGRANTSGIETTVTGPARMSFRYTLNSCPSGDSQLRVLVDGREILVRISDYGGQFAVWKMDELEIGAGAHTVRFEFVLRTYLGGVFNGACLDEVLFDALARPPHFLPASGSSSSEDEENAYAFSRRQVVAIGSEDPSDEIYYTLDGSDPTMQDGIRYEGPFEITKSTLVKAIAISGIRQPSKVSSAFYVERHAVVPGELSTDVRNTLDQASRRQHAKILLTAYSYEDWRFDAALKSSVFREWAAANDVFLLTYDPYESMETAGVYDLLWGWHGDLGEPPLDYPFLIMADSSGIPQQLVVCKSGQTVGAATFDGSAESLVRCMSGVMYGTATVVAAPIMQPNGVLQNYPLTVTLTNPNGTGTLYYTVDGSAPNRTNGRVYAGPFTLTSPSTVKAVVWPETGSSSLVAELQYMSFQGATGLPVGVWSGGGTVPWRLDPNGAEDVIASGDGGRETAWDSWVRLQINGPGRLVYTLKTGVYSYQNRSTVEVDGNVIYSCHYPTAEGSTTETVTLTNAFTEAGTHAITWRHEVVDPKYFYASSGCGLTLSGLRWLPYVSPTAYVVRFVRLADVDSPFDEKIFEREQVVNLPVATSLFAPPAGKRFAGWACSNGRRYDDGMLVFDLAEPGETVTMTAVWE